MLNSYVSGRSNFLNFEYFAIMRSDDHLSKREDVQQNGTTHELSNVKHKLPPESKVHIIGLRIT